MELRFRPDCVVNDPRHAPMVDIDAPIVFAGLRGFRPAVLPMRLKTHIATLSRFGMVLRWEELAAPAPIRWRTADESSQCG
jgi:hypothetical protein